MNLETTKKAAYLWRNLHKVEDRITFLRQFIPAKKEDRCFWFRGKNLQPPRLEVYTLISEESNFFSMDDEMTGFVIQALEAKRDNILKEIDAL